VKEYNGKDQNEVKGYKAALSSSAPAAASTGAAPKPGGW